jgi:hypothetical protein
MLCVPSPAVSLILVAAREPIVMPETELNPVVVYATPVSPERTVAGYESTVAAAVTGAIVKENVTLEPEVLSQGLLVPVVPEAVNTS